MIKYTLKLLWYFIKSIIFGFFIYAFIDWATPKVLYFSWWQLLMPLIFICVYKVLLSYWNSYGRSRLYMGLSKKACFFSIPYLIFGAFSIIEPWKNGVIHFTSLNWLLAILITYFSFSIFKNSISTILHDSILIKKKVYKKSSDLGNEYAKSICYNGFSFETGQVEWIRDSLKSFRYFKERAIKGDAKAQLTIGLCCYNGIMTFVNYSNAVKWFKKSAEQGLPEAQFILGICYANGTGVKCNDVLASDFLSKAANQGLQKAHNELNKLTKYKDEIL